MRFLSLLFVFILCVGFTSYGQSVFRVSGNLLDNQKKLLKDLPVTLLRTKDSSVVKSIVNNTDGSFLLETGEPGKYFVKVAALGFTTYFSAPFDLNSAATAKELGNITIGTAPITLQEINVQSEKQFIERDIDKMVVNVENSIVANGTTALELLQKIPGVSLGNDDRISLRGKAGVLIMINGKENRLSAEQLTEMLRNMSGNNISQIELVNNPSGKFDAEGSGGIINIKMKKLNNSGFNGTVNGRLGQGVYSKAGSGLSLNYRNDKVNMNGSVDYGYKKNFFNYIDDKYFHNGNETNYIFGGSNKKLERNAVKANAGIDLFLTKKSTLGFTIDYFSNSGTSAQTGKSVAKDSDLKTDSVVTNTLDDNINFRNYAYNVNYKLITDTTGGSLLINADYSKYDDRNRNRLFFKYADSTGTDLSTPLWYRSYQKSDINIYSVKADYTKYFTNDLRLEAGAKMSWVKVDANLQFNNLIDEKEIVNSLFTNHFLYEERIQAGYFNLKKTFTNTTIQVGLRGEKTYSKGNSVTKQQVVDTSYFNLFPSLFVSHKLNPENVLAFSYSRRINRPNYQDLNSFLYFADPFTYFSGNPFLKPQYSNSFSLSYTYDNKYSVSVDYMKTNRVIASVLENYPDVPGALVGVKQNLDYQSLFSVDLSGTTDVTKWWTMNNDLQVFYTQFKGDFGLGAVNNDRFAYVFNSSHDFSISDRWKAQASFIYNSPTSYSIYKISENYVVGAGIMKYFLKNKKLSAKLSIDDIFYTNKQTFTTDNQTFGLKEIFRTDSRQVRLSITYQFSKGKGGGKSQSSKSNEEESRRVRSSNSN